jgi:hypothetical protein
MADDQKQVVSERNIPHSPGIVPKNKPTDWIKRYQDEHHTLCHRDTWIEQVLQKRSGASTPEPEESTLYVI